MTYDLMTSRHCVYVYIAALCGGGERSSLYSHSFVFFPSGWSTLSFPFVPPWFLFLLPECASAVLVTGLRGRKRGEKIVTCSKNSPPSLWAIWGWPHSYLHTLEDLWSGSGPSFGLFLGHWLQQEMELWSCTHRLTICTQTGRVLIWLWQIETEQYSLKFSTVPSAVI